MIKTSTMENNETFYSLVGMDNNPRTFQKVLFWVLSFGIAVVFVLVIFSIISLLPDGSSASGWV